MSTNLAQILGEAKLHEGVPERHVYSVSPYKFKKGAAAGVPYVASYVQPQLEPFVREGVLAGYGLYLNSHDLADWNYLLISEYADTAAFGTRNKGAARGPLLDDPAWKTIHEVKGEIREELAMFFSERLAPILMTMLATGLALVPLALTGNIAGQEIEYPMASVILGGLVTSTLLNLFVVPSLYLRFGRSKAERLAAMAWAG